MVILKIYKNNLLIDDRIFTNISEGSKHMWNIKNLFSTVNCSYEFEDKIIYKHFKNGRPHGTFGDIGTLEIENKTATYLVRHKRFCLKSKFYGECCQRHSNK